MLHLLATRQSILATPDRLRLGRIVIRARDVAGACGGLLIFGPLIVAAAIIARCDTGASGIYRQRRIGRRGRTFWIYKIRTMRPGSERTDAVTIAGDPRVTPVGRWLRMLKIDELPQLWNILRGDMSFVGPRPDVPEFLPMHRKLAPATLDVRPGLTGPAQLLFFDEERLLARVARPIEFNREVLFPAKLRINDAYVRDQRWWRDAWWLLLTLVPQWRHAALTAEHRRWLADVVAAIPAPESQAA